MSIIIDVFRANTSGRLSMSIGDHLSIHLLPKKGDVLWGLVEDWYDGRHFLFGMGRLALITWW